ncbi:hypothetical protein GCK32_017418 [Trichostrongylus colubriformis]
MINIFYQCYAKCSGIKSKCVNGGVPNPRHCSTNCICPAGYGGALCNTRAPAGKKVQIRVTALQGVNCTNGCWVHAIEPKIDTDKRLTNSSRLFCSLRPKDPIPFPAEEYAVQNNSSNSFRAASIQHRLSLTVFVVQLLSPTNTDM